MHALLATLWQSDTAFPSGSFAFSSGVEGAAALSGSLDKTALRNLLASTLRHRWASTDRLAMLYAFHADGIERLATIDQALEAATLPEPLRTGSRRNGAGFLTAHDRVRTPGAAELRAAVAARRCLGHLPVAQGWIWRRCGLDETSAVAASGYTSVAAMIQAAVRLGVLGALEAQAVLFDLLADIAASAAEPFDPAGAIVFASITPWLEIAVMRHAHAGVRLFSN